MLRLIFPIVLVAGLFAGAAQASTSNASTQGQASGQVTPAIGQVTDHWQFAKSSEAEREARKRQAEWEREARKRESERDREEAARDREERKRQAERERERRKRQAEREREYEKWEAEREREYEKREAEREREEEKWQAEREREEWQREREDRRREAELERDRTQGQISGADDTVLDQATAEVERRAREGARRVLEDLERRFEETIRQGTN